MRKTFLSLYSEITRVVERQKSHKIMSLFDYYYSFY